MQLSSCSRLQLVLTTCNLVYHVPIPCVLLLFKWNDSFLWPTFAVANCIFWENFSFFSSFYLFSDVGSITQVETVDSFVEFLPSHGFMENSSVILVSSLSQVNQVIRSVLDLGLASWVLGLDFGSDSQESFENTVKVQTKYSLYRQNLTNVRMRTKWIPEVLFIASKIQMLYFHNTSE